MNYTENSKEVILLYLSDIEYCYQEFLKYLLINNDSSLFYKLFQIVEKKINLRDKYLNMLPPTILDSNNKVLKNFRLNIINKRIFSDIKEIKISDNESLYALLITVENKIINFLQDYFYRFTYVSSKHFIDAIIYEKQQFITSLQSLKEA